MFLLPLIVSFRFSRGSVQTILPPSRKGRAGRLCTSLGERITEMEKEATEIERIVREKRGQKRKLDNDQNYLKRNISNLKVKF